MIRAGSDRSTGARSRPRRRSTPSAASSQRPTALGHTTSQTYDAAGNVLTETDANDQTTTYTYNAFGQVLTITDPLGRATTNTYDADGNLTSEIAARPGDDDVRVRQQRTAHLDDRSQRPHHDVHQRRGRATRRRITDPAGNTTHQVFDPQTGWLTSVTDPTGATTSIEYDANGNLTASPTPTATARRYTYDDFGRMTSLTDARARRCAGPTTAPATSPPSPTATATSSTYAYDAEGRLTSKTVPGAGTSTYTYDPWVGRPTRDNAAAQLTFTYDDADNVLTATSAGTAASPQPTVTFTYTYDAAGRTDVGAGPGGTTGYGYDAADRAHVGHRRRRRTVQLRLRPARPADGDDPPQRRHRHHDLRRRRAADRAHVATRRDRRRPSGYTYDPAGRRTSLTTPAGTTNFGYDPGSQLISATYPAAHGHPRAVVRLRPRRQPHVDGDRAAGFVSCYDDGEPAARRRDQRLHLRLRGQHARADRAGDGRDDVVHVVGRAPTDRDHVSRRDGDDVRVRRARTARRDRRRGRSVTVTSSTTRTSRPSTTTRTRSPRRSPTTASRTPRTSR